VFQLVAIAIFGPMIFALLGVLAYAASSRALACLRTSRFLNFVPYFKKNSEQNGWHRNIRNEGRENLPSPCPKETNGNTFRLYFYEPRKP